ncbi:MAG: adenosylcobinamide-GDP ribazoletransferase [Gammaproteobacteria bacterium]|nr:adenosylcobinamide-GDP ribazoletransferase [Gammaproteobacteria bacterium]
MRPFFIALQFLTRLPVRIAYEPDAISISHSLAYYPLVGLIISGLLASFAWALSDVPALLSAGLLLAVWVLVTGGLHIDGLADSMDAWAGGFGDRERTLAIMKDPYCGPAGVAGIVLLLLLKFAALHAIIESDGLTVLLLVPMLGRTILLLLFITTPYVRENGLGTAIVSQLSRKLILLIFIATLVVTFLLVGIKSLWLIAVMMLVFILSRMLMMQRIGGMTGDAAGALVEVTEVTILISAVFIY